jgi:DNA/RNA endonuclease G (NUC1)
MRLLALIFLVVAIGAIVFEFALLSILRADHPVIEALPALAPFLALVATVFFSLNQDAWVSEATKRVVKFVQKRPAILYVGSVTGVCVAAALGWYVFDQMGAKQGTYTVQVVKLHDVEGDYLPGIPVIIEQKLEDLTEERVTNAKGIARFEVNPGDVFAVRVRQSADPDAPILVLDSNARVDKDNLDAYSLVRIEPIPAESWIKREESSALAAEQVFSRLPSSYFQWQSKEVPINKIDIGGADFPFTLPEAEAVIAREAFTVGFSPVLKLPRWAAYKIVPGEVPPRINDAPFAADPALPASYQASSSDYRGNDYDRGHLVRRSDVAGIPEAATRQVHFLTAVVPQLSYVNQKSWLALEQHTSEMVSPSRDIYVIRGPIYQPETGSEMVNVTFIGSNMIPVPTHFFQITVAWSNAIEDIEAYIVPNAYETFEPDLAQFKSTIAAISNATGLIFGQELSD